MQILSHRGFWQSPEEMNSVDAFERSFDQGFGTETDIRDFTGNLVISHDIADKSCIELSEFLDYYRQGSQNLPLALNVKSDGLQALLETTLQEQGIENYFVFDMSIPDMVGYLRAGLKTFTRQSEYETNPALYEQVNGVWLDEFHSHWIDEAVIAKHISNGKKVCIVSPELHRRQYQDEWNHYRDIDRKLGSDAIMLCTDYPIAAREFFDAKN